VATIAVPELTALGMTAGGILLAVSCLLSRVGARFGVPVSLVFLAVGMLAGCNGPGGIEFRDFSLAYVVGTMALAAVLFAGGLQTNYRCIKTVLAPASVLATVGMLGIAAITAWCAYAIGRPWREAWLVGAIVSSTDASAVFGILSGVRLPKRVSNTIELESGPNDPIAVIRTFAKTSAIVGESLPLSQLVLQMLYQVALGAAFGLALGHAARYVLIQMPPSTPALYPVMTLGFAMIAFGAPAVLDGSGFLAVYIAGIFIGNSKLPNREQIVRVHDSLSWLAQVSMFLLLGLLVNPRDLPAVAVPGTLIALAVAFVAWPIAANFVCCRFATPHVSECIFLGWGFAAPCRSSWRLCRFYGPKVSWHKWPTCSMFLT
jgi:potassium/hydrogen antiporter